MNHRNAFNESDAKQKMGHYKELQSKLSKSSRSYSALYHKLENYIKGLEGEASTAYELKYLPEGYYVIHNLFLKIGDVQAQIDHLVLSSKGFFLLESKFWNGKISVDEYNHWYIEDKNGKKRGVSNPYNQSQRHSEVLSRFFKLFSESNNLSPVDIPFTSIVVLASIEHEVHLQPNERVTKVDGIVRTIKEAAAQNDDVLSQHAIIQFGNYLLSQNIEPMDIYKRLNIRDQDLIQPIKFRDGSVVNSPVELIESIDIHWDECVRFLKNGTLKNWFESIGNEDGVNLITKVLSLHSNIQCSLEDFVSFNPWKTLSKPKISVKPREIVFRNVNHGELCKAYVDVSNTGRGLLYGELTARDSFNLTNPCNFDGNYSSFKIPIYTDEVSNRTKQIDGEILIKSNGGNIKIPYSIYFNYPVLSLLYSVSKYGLMTASLLLGIFGIQQFLFLSESPYNFSLVFILFLFSFIALSFTKLKKSQKIFLSILIGLFTPYLFMLTSFIYYPLTFGSIGLEDGRLHNILGLIPVVFFGLLLGVTLLGIPKWFNSPNQKLFRSISRFIGFASIIVLLGFSFTSEFAKQFYNHNQQVSPITNSTMATPDNSDNEVKPVFVEFTVNLAFKEDTGSEIYFLNSDDMQKLNIKENQKIELISPTSKLLLSAKSHSRVDSGTIRMRESVRNKLKIQPGDKVKFETIIP